MRKMFLCAASLLLLHLLFTSCDQKKTTFTSLPAHKTGIHFQNNLNESDTFNILDYLYFYNGGGVAAGDFNNDGLEDIYFTSNQGSNKLYLNKGDLNFEDITVSAGVAGKGNWKTGVTLADVNMDGLLDIYVSEVGNYKSLKGKNELFINNGLSKEGKLSFTERAAEYGLDLEGFNTQASFFDYDNDGDLDVFIVNHSVHSTESYTDAAERNKLNLASGDKLLRCDKKGEHVFYTDVTTDAGIYSSVIGYGLNVMTADFNNDGWRDIYVSNDFHENDYYYINNQNGTFTEKNKQAFGHESRFSMGSDVADINNDGWLDIMTLDMLPADETVLKSSVSDDPLSIYQFKMDKGYHHQYARNCLQLNVDGGKHYSDIALYANVAATDWSWSPLLADFDNDGVRDLFVSNGIVRRPNDLDFIKFVSSTAVSKALQDNRQSDQIAIDKMPAGKISNIIYKGSKDLRFIDKSVEWGVNEPSFSNGAVYADLDNDGDLDIIVNNINSVANVYRNNTNEDKVNHFVEIKLQGKPGNKFGYGAKLLLKQGSEVMYAEVTSTRGFESASSTVVHFGLGTNKDIDILQVIWPDGTTQSLAKPQADRLITIKQDEDTREEFPPSRQQSEPLLIDYTDSIPLDFKHTENRFEDFDFQQLIPHEISTQGPAIAVGDVDGDGLDDFFVCGAKGQAGAMFRQTNEGKFVKINQELFGNDRRYESVHAVFFDADGDKDEDLYVVSGGNESISTDSALLDRLYINDGKGSFSKSSKLPAFFSNKSVAAPYDFDHDGDIDLFVGGRVVSNAYGKIPPSYLLINDGKANFTIADGSITPGFNNLGMVTGAVWNDIDRDGWKDLVIVGEWMPITVMKNEKGFLSNVTSALDLKNTSGLWTTITAADLNGDGVDELLAGNFGINTKLIATKQMPLLMYAGDIDGNGSMDQFLAVAKGKKYYSFLGKEEMERAIPGIIRKNFLSYTSMAGLTVEEILHDRLNSLQQFSVHTLASVIIKNVNGKLIVDELPPVVQWSPVFSFLAVDVNFDKKPDILAGGNFYGVVPYEGRYDASIGTVLLSNGDFSWKELPVNKSGFRIEGEVRDIKKIHMKNGQLYLIARNNNMLQLYRNTH